jgi:hypothetical protein
MDKFVVQTQVLENYGAHCEDGKFASGNAYWKFKGGTTYIVSDVEREQDAVAFVAAAFSDNSLGYKEFPTHWTTYDKWLDELASDSEDYQEFQKETAMQVSPKTGRETQKGDL